jgi:hypothetical protein
LKPVGELLLTGVAGEAREKGKGTMIDTRTKIDTLEHE